MAEPIDMAAARERRDRGDYDGQACAQCGCAWFDATVVFSPGGAINGFAQGVKCHDCGHPAHPNGVV